MKVSEIKARKPSRKRAGLKERGLRISLKAIRKENES
jgi:hypothetical protein